jgi:hypothetical protein
VNRWGKSKYPIPIHLDEKELHTNLGRENYIFVCSGCDLFASKVPMVWRQRVFDYTRYFTYNRYLWHTKNPGLVLPLQDRFTERDMLCVTIESNRKYPAISQAHPPNVRFCYLIAWKKQWMMTIEPVLDFDTEDFMACLFSTGNMPVQVNIGADSGHNHLLEPSNQKIEQLIELLAPHTRVYLKPNLRRLLPEHGLYGQAVQSVG